MATLTRPFFPAFLLVLFFVTMTALLFGVLSASAGAVLFDAKCIEAFKRGECNTGGQDAVNETWCAKRRVDADVRGCVVQIQGEVTLMGPALEFE